MFNLFFTQGLKNADQLFVKVELGSNQNSVVCPALLDEDIEDGKPCLDVLGFSLQEILSAQQRNDEARAVEV